jgi:hypothetical protein
MPHLVIVARRDGDDIVAGELELPPLAEEPVPPLWREGFAMGMHLLHQLCRPPLHL